MSNADEILKLKELLDNGIITNEEFEKKKKELLEVKDNPKVSFEDETNITSNSKNKKMGCFSSTILVVIILSICFIIFGQLVIEPSNERFYNNQEVIEGLVTSYDDFLYVLKQCGFNDYSLERDEMLDELDGEGTIGVRIKTQNANGIIYIKDGAIYSVRYADNYLYKDGTMLHTLMEF